MLLERGRIGRILTVKRLSEEIVNLIDNLAVHRIDSHRTDLALGVKDDRNGIVGRRLAHVLHIVHFLV